MQHISDVVPALLSLSMAACAASYFWIFLYRPASLPQLEALVGYKHFLGSVYMVVAGFGLGFTLWKGIEPVLWWAPETWTLSVNGEPRPAASVVALGLGHARLAVYRFFRIGEIAQRMSATQDKA